LLEGCDEGGESGAHVNRLEGGLLFQFSEQDHSAQIKMVKLALKNV
jgi:hypothetical protein